MQGLFVLLTKTFVQVVVLVMNVVTVVYVLTS